MITQADLKAVKGPLAGLALVALAAAGAVYYGDVFVQQAHEQLQQSQGKLKEARTRLQKSGDEKELIVRYLGSYQQLQRIGFVGEEQRINWLDGLRISNQRVDLFGVEYQISAQRPYPHATDFHPGQLVLSESHMKLRFRALHEEDPMRFFNALARLGAGVFTIDQCVLRRLDTGGVIRYQPNVLADCDLSWITVKVGTPTEKKP
ncbi:MAG: hypothetical protein HY323_04820 [Betaproteobacteria bacterium]|nr:hypothetical protein [Betaproteobacteria bacterium]